MHPVLSFPEGDVYLQIARENHNSSGLPAPDKTIIEQFIDLLNGQLHLDADIGVTSHASLNVLTVKTLLAE